MRGQLAATAGGEDYVQLILIYGQNLFEFIYNSFLSVSELSSLLKKINLKKANYE